MLMHEKPCLIPILVYLVNTVWHCDHLVGEEGAGPFALMVFGACSVCLLPLDVTDRRCDVAIPGHLYFFYFSILTNLPLKQYAIFVRLINSIYLCKI